MWSRLWAGSRTVADLYRYIHASMPPGNAGSLTDETYAALAALIMRENNATADAALAPDEAKLVGLTLPPGEGVFVEVRQ